MSTQTGIPYPRYPTPAAWESPANTPEPEASPYQPGSAIAEEAADAILRQAKRCLLRLAGCLRRAAEENITAAPGLLAAAAAMEDSCAYVTESQLRRPPRKQGRYQTQCSLEALDGFLSLPSTGVHWLSQLVDNDLEALAASVGLAGLEATLWIAHVRGEPLPGIAVMHALPLSTAYRYLRRAQRKASESWLGAYYETQHA